MKVELLPFSTSSLRLHFCSPNFHLSNHLYVYISRLTSDSFITTKTHRKTQFFFAHNDCYNNRSRDTKNLALPADMQATFHTKCAPDISSIKNKAVLPCRWFLHHRGVDLLDASLASMLLSTQPLNITTSYV